MTDKPSFLQLARSSSVVQRAIRIALVVGTLLVAINHGQALLSLQMDLTRWIQVILTYFVPYGVSTYASVQALRSTQVE